VAQPEKDGSRSLLTGREVSVSFRDIANVLEDGELPPEGELHFLQIRGPMSPMR
jgi:hypothetical protein